MKTLLHFILICFSLLTIHNFYSEAQELVTRFAPRVGGTPYHAIATDHEGNILVFQYFDHINGLYVGTLAKLDRNGDPDDEFNSIFTDGKIANLQVQADGKMLISGDFSVINGTPTSNLVRLNPDGSIDPSFRPLTVTSLRTLRTITD